MGPPLLGIYCGTLDSPSYILQIAMLLGSVLMPWWTEGKKRGTTVALQLTISTVVHLPPLSSHPRCTVSFKHVFSRVTENGHVYNKPTLCI